MKLFSFTSIICALFVAYLAHSIWVIYGLFYPSVCKPPATCLHPFTARNPALELRVYTALKERGVGERSLTLVWHHSNFSIDETVSRSVNVTIPRKARSNGTLYAHVFVHPRGQDPFVGTLMSHIVSNMTEFAVPKSTYSNLLTDSTEQTNELPKPRAKPITHWRQKLTVSVMTGDIAFDRNTFPGELHRYVQLSDHGYYLPIVYVDELSQRVRDLLPVNESTREMPLEITYQPISVGKLRLWIHLQESIKLMQGLGFNEKDTDEIKGIFVDTNFYFLALTFGIAALHLLFDFLAFKHDISYWKNRDSMVGLSSRVVVWRCISTGIIFFYLLDEDTSMLVLIPAGLGTLIEVWKVKKAFKVTIKWHGITPSLQFGTTSAQEKETAQFDSQAMKYLSYVLYPLCLAGAVYSLLYVEHKSWYSWCVQSLVNGVYAFGFLFMLPQLFVNYKLKSVAHLPWRAFMYKAFNTFIDDLFAMIITMPTIHRLACFRDDIVFLIYLYQRWLYPVDKSRVNEYGMSYEDTPAVKDETKKDK